MFQLVNISFTTLSSLLLPWWVAPLRRHSAEQSSPRAYVRSAAGRDITGLAGTLDRLYLGKPEVSRADLALAGNQQAQSTVADSVQQPGPLFV